MNVHYIILDEDVYSAIYLSELLEAIRPAYCLCAVFDDPDDAGIFLSDYHVDLIFCDRSFLESRHIEGLQHYRNGNVVIFTDSQGNTKDNFSTVSLLKPYSKTELEYALLNYESKANNRHKTASF